ncbi:hypothetical protein ASC95_07530 [Pelomonas sp. Root1217]|uniref:PEP-CTERM sorting domain-containing protein n=1 Tax=Pelomonas sp. Root1217 TaxID=1736430 RepID=UPI00070B9000|nr:PEP-CTERM sorting domain-containing protein [Pelomonas sp. Root1217]KQV52665.1 hypothetical protein ASC95_07530 [Pelomonas sp. Root1217]
MRELKILASAIAALAMSSGAAPAAAAPQVEVDFTTGCSLFGGQGFSSGRLGFFKAMDTLGPCDVTITVSGMVKGGSFNFEISEGVRNNSAFNWHDFHHSLGYRMNGVFKRSGTTDGVYFSVDPPKTGENFTLTGQDDPSQANSLDWVASGPDFANDGIGVNDFHFGLHISDVDESGNADNDGVTTFVLRQQATIPEPGALSLWLLVSGAGLLASRRRRQTAAPTFAH